MHTKRRIFCCFVCICSSNWIIWSIYSALFLYRFTFSINISEKMPRNIQKWGMGCHLTVHNVQEFTFFFFVLYSISYNNLPRYIKYIMTSLNDVTGFLWGEPAGQGWIPLREAKKNKLFVFSLICARRNNGANNRDVCDLRHHCVHYNVTGMIVLHCPQDNHMITHVAVS